MKNEEIRKLLGGYATNTLTESERSALFEAALEDQELFNALEDEQALKELLADSRSREAIQRALAEPVERKHSAWWSKRLLWGGLASAAAAAVLIVAVVHRTVPVQNSGRIEIASTQEPAKSVLEENRAVPEQSPAIAQSPGIADRGLKQATPALPSPKAERRELNLRQLSRDNPAPGSADQIAASAAPQAPSTKSEQATVEAEAKPAAGGIGGMVGGLTSATTGFAASLKVDPVRYSLLKKDGRGVYSPISSQAELRPGDSVRLSVSIAVGGRLSLYRQDSSGEWKLIFPESVEGRLLAANNDYTIPEAAIEVGNSAEKFRISLTVEDGGARGKTVPKQSVGTVGALSAPGIVPVTVDFTIGPGGG